MSENYQESTKRTNICIDLHAHTNASDGEFSPSKLIDLAISKNISALTISDHDTVDGIEEAINYAKGKNILVIPGVEINTKVEKGQMHILGQFIDHRSEKLRKALEWSVNGRNTRNNEFIRLFNERGLNVTLDELIEVSGGTVIGKPHFAKVFLEKGYISDKIEIFDKYFNKFPFTNVQRFLYDSKDVIKMIHEAGGVAILAHPQSLKLNDDELEVKIKELISYGLDGLECYHSGQTKEQMHVYRQLANKYNLIVTKGSDFHGPIVKPNIELGTGLDCNIVNDEENHILETLLKKACK